MNGMIKVLVAAALAAVSCFGNAVPADVSVGADILTGKEAVLGNGRLVGLFYFLWLGEHGRKGPYDVTKILGQIADGMMLWFYSEDEQLPHLWRDHYYVCHQHSEEPTNGFFHLMVTVPTEERPEPTLRIFYPDSAEGSPFIVFTKYKEGGGVEEDEKSRDLIQLENWSPKDSVEEGYPMYAIGDASIVEKMLNNDVAYLMFVSGESSNGDPGETEIARLGLSSFQELWKKKVH